MHIKIVKDEYTDPLKRYSNINEYVAEYKSYLSQASEIIELKDKPLGQANRENVSWLVFYDERLKNLKTILNYITMDMEKLYGMFYAEFKEGYKLELKQTEISFYINNKPAYLNFKALHIEINDLYEKYKTIVTALEHRGYLLNNLTKIYIADIQNRIIE
jgi:hypothetical protein